MSHNQLVNLFTHGADTAEYLFKAQGEIFPMWLAQDQRGRRYPLVISDMSDKDKAADAVKTWLKEKNIIRYVHMIECWVLEGHTKDIPQEIIEGKSIEHHQDRREAIHVMAEDREGNAISGCYYILRPEHSKVTLSPFKKHEKMQSEGRFVKMFT